jgi:hypothetical protein
MESTIAGPLPPKVTLASESSPASMSSLTIRRSGPSVLCSDGKISFDALRKTLTYAASVIGDVLSRELSEAVWPVLGGLVGCVLSFMLGWWLRNG